MLVILSATVGIWPSLSIRESLWVDELHSVWAVSGGWNEVASRAALGNQSPLYFFGLKAWSDTAGTMFDGALSDETMLRALSLLGWWILCVLVFESIYRKVPSSAVLATMIVIAIWLWLDRIGAFYAIELRPYIWVAVVSVVLMRSGAKTASFPNRLGFAWLLSSAILFYLHYTSIFVVAFSWLACVASIAMQWNGLEVLQRRKIIRLRVVELIVLTATFFPGLWHLNQMLGKSKQWANFANNLSVSTAVDLLPWLFWVLIPMFAFEVHRVFRKEHQELSPLKTPLVTTWRYQIFAVGIGILLFVWLLTYSEIAPLWHRRYVMGAYPAIILLGAFWLGRIQSQRALIVTGFLSASLLVWWQGTLGEWRAGRIIAWQRQEDWRGAVSFLNEQRKPNEPLFLAPMLIETAGSEIDPKISASYLRFAISSVYRVYGMDSIEVLPNCYSSWAAKIVESSRNDLPSTIWIIARVDDATIFDAISSLRGTGRKKMSEHGGARETYESSLHANSCSLLPGNPGRRAGDEGHFFQAIQPLTPQPPLPEDGARGRKSSNSRDLVANTISSGRHGTAFKPVGMNTNSTRPSHAVPLSIVFTEYLSIERVFSGGRVQVLKLEKR